MQSLKEKEIHEKLYNLESWISPQIDNNEYHKSIELENKMRFQKNFKEFQVQIANQETYDQTNDLIDNIKKQKKQILDSLQQGKRLNLRELFQGQKISDPELEYRFQKKIQYIENKLQKIMQSQGNSIDVGQEDITPDDSSTSHQSQAKSKDHRSSQQKNQQARQQLNRNLDKVLKIFQERDSVFDSMTRSKLDRIQRRLKLAPPIGQYTPKYELVDGKMPQVSFTKSQKQPLFKQETSQDMAADYGDQIPNLQFKNNTFDTVRRQSVDKNNTDANGPFRFSGNESPDKGHGKLTSNSFMDQDPITFTMLGNATMTSKTPFSIPIKYPTTKYSQRFTQRCARSLITREQSRDGSASSQNKLSPQTNAQKLIPNFQKKGSRKIIVGARDVNENRFSFRPEKYLDKLSNYKRLPSCSIHFTRQVYRDGYSLTKPSTTVNTSGNTAKPSHQKRQERSNQSMTFGMNGFGIGSQNLAQGSRLSPGYYNPKYNLIDMRREDTGIHSWSIGKDSHSTRRPKFDVTKIIKKKEDGSPASGFQTSGNDAYQQSIDNVLNDQYKPNYQRYAPRFKPYTLEDIETEKNSIYPFKKYQAPIENTYLNYLPHQTPYYDPNLYAHTGHPFPQLPYPGSPTLAPSHPHLLMQHFQPDVFPSHYLIQEKQKSHLASLQRQQIDLKLKIEVEKLERAKQQLEAEVYHGLKKKVKKEVNRQKRDLNDKDDLEMMDVIKRHQDHLQNLQEGLDDNHIWLLVRDNELQHKKVDEINLAQELRERRKMKDRQQDLRKMEKKMMDMRLKEIKSMHRKQQDAHLADDEQPPRSKRELLREKREAEFKDKRDFMEQINLMNRDRMENIMRGTNNPLMQKQQLPENKKQQKQSQKQLSPKMRTTQSHATLPSHQNQGNMGTSYSKKSAYAGVAPQFAPHPHYYPPFPLPDEGDQFFYPPLS